MTSELEPRVTALETTVQILGDRVRMSEHDAAAARILAGGAEHDVIQIRDELRADLNTLREQNNRQHNATREDLTDLRQTVEQGFAKVDREFAKVDKEFAKVDKGFAEVDKGFAEVDKGFATMRGRLDATAAGQDQIVTMLNELISRQRPDDD